MILPGLILLAFSWLPVSRHRIQKQRLPATDSTQKTDQAKMAVIDTTVPPAAIILKRKEIPILCYHQIRDWRPTDSKTARAYIVPVAAFQEQIKMLADSGYHTILPDELYAYLTQGDSSSRQIYFADFRRYRS